MKAVFSVLLVSVMFWGVIGDNHEAPVCPFQQNSKACAWIPSCTVPGCETQCVANIYGENHLVHNLENLYEVASLCTAVSSTVRGAAAGMAGRRLQAIHADVSGILKAFKSSFAFSKTSRKMLQTTDAACATPAEVDAAAPAMGMIAALTEGLAQEATMEDAEKAAMDAMLTLFKDAGKMNDWLSSKCTTVTLEGDNLASHLEMNDMESGDMPTSMAVCLASDEKIRTLVTQIHDVMDENSECAGALTSIEHGLCIGMDATVMSDTCMNKVAPILSLDSADVTKATSAWTAIHEACVAITDEAECQAKTMDEKVQEAQTAMARMDADSSDTAVAIAEEISGSHAITMGYTVAIVLSLVAMLM